MPYNKQGIKEHNFRHETGKFISEPNHEITEESWKQTFGATVLEISIYYNGLYEIFKCVTHIKVHSGAHFSPC